VLRDLRPGKRLFLLSTGTGFAPFSSLIKDPEVYERFEQVITVRGARTVRDLAYGDSVIRRLRAEPDLAEHVGDRLTDYPTVTREPFVHQGRITMLIESGKLCADLGLPPLDPATDRVMVCGGMGMLKDLRTLLDRLGFEISPGVGDPGDYVIERAFVDA
jgi:ferredoxin/flavodoxin---NADP+ reductase